MITRVENLTDEKLDEIKRLIGEAFVPNELFHNWGSESERRDDVLKYMSMYVDYVYKAGELYTNEDMTGFIGIEDSGRKPVVPQIVMLNRMMTGFSHSKKKSFIQYVKQVSRSNKKYAKKRHLEVLMVCVDKDHQGQGVATELVQYAKKMADTLDLPLIFDTDMKKYAEMYMHMGCKLYNMIPADNGVTRYSLCYKKTL